MKQWHLRKPDRGKIGLGWQDGPRLRVTVLPLPFSSMPGEAMVGKPEKQDSDGNTGLWSSNAEETGTTGLGRQNGPRLPAACTTALRLPFSSKPGPAMVRKAKQQDSDGTTGLGLLLLAQQLFLLLFLQCLVKQWHLRKPEKQDSEGKTGLGFA